MSTVTGKLLHQMTLEMLQEDFTCVSFGLTAWARVPREPARVPREEAAPPAPQPEPL